MAFDPIAYNNEYTRNNYDVIRALVPKGKGAVVKEEAAARGISVSKLIIDALEECYKLDLNK